MLTAGAPCKIALSFAAVAFYAACRPLLPSYTPVYTSDIFRDTYAPNTIPEETFFGHNLSSSARDAAIVQTARINQAATRVRTAIAATDTPEFKRFNVTSVRCPNRWKAVGPFCTTVSLVQPYTECPLSFRRYRSGPRNPVEPIPELPGLCQRIETTGVTLKCPDTFELLTEEAHDGKKRALSIECRSYTVTPYPTRSARSVHVPMGQKDVSVCRGSHQVSHVHPDTR